MRMFRTAAVLAASLLASACSGHVASLETDGIGRTVERIYNNNGGLVSVQARDWIARESRHQIAHYVIDGSCVSYCSFAAFTKPDTCYTANARLGVHPVSIGGITETEATKRVTDWYVARWPQSLREWWIANRPSVLGRDLVYEDLKKIMPERECRDNMARG